MDREVKSIIWYYCKSLVSSTVITISIGILIWFIALWINQLKIITYGVIFVVRMIGLIIPMIALHDNHSLSLTTWGIASESNAEKISDKINKILLWLGFAINFFAELLVEA